MDTIDSDKRSSAEQLQPVVQQEQQHNGGDDNDGSQTDGILPAASTSIADVDDILQYEGEEVTIDSQQTTANVPDEEAEVYLELSSVDGDFCPDDTNVSQSESMDNSDDTSLISEMVIVEETTIDVDKQHDQHHQQPDEVKPIAAENEMRTETVMLVDVDDDDDDDDDDYDENLVPIDDDDDDYDENLIPIDDDDDDDYDEDLVPINPNDDDRTESTHGTIDGEVERRPNVNSRTIDDDRVTSEQKSNPKRQNSNLSAASASSSPTPLGHTANVLKSTPQQAPQPPAPSAPQQFGHTVNLLNNNKILIKSVKSSNSASGSPTLAKDEIPLRSDKPNETSSISNVADSSECRTSCDKSSGNSGAGTGDGTRMGNDEKTTVTSAPSNPPLHEHDSVKVSQSTTAALLAAAAATPSSPQPKLNREYEMLTKTVNESKVLTEFIIDQSTRGRRSLKASTKRKQQLIPNTSMGSELSTVSTGSEEEALMRIESPIANEVRGQSKESDGSTATSGGGTQNTNASGSGGGKRSTRSQNSDFSAKQKRFLRGIQEITRGTDDESENSAFDDDEDDIDFDCPMETKQPSESSIAAGSFAQSKNHGDEFFGDQTANNSMATAAVPTKTAAADSDTFCWRCHQGDCQIACTTCIRAYHSSCVKVKQSVPHEQSDWQCPECMDLQAAEHDDKKKFEPRHLSRLLKFAMDRILIDASTRQFQFPLDKKNYSENIKNPIDLHDIESNVDSMRYTTTEAFSTDIKWILHNCYVSCANNYKLMAAAKSLLKVCKQEMFDIETCAECYLNANTMVDNWFTEVCAKPHLILWAKLKGFPYWPAKAMSINAQIVDVRFFGDHDRAYVPAKDCFLYSRQDPNPPTNKYKRNTIADCVKEVDIYIENIIAKFGSFNYAELKTAFNPYNELQHLVEMIPGTRSGRPRRRSTAYKSDLKLCIVKTADNNLSVVKRSPMPSKIIDLIDENSSTPPPSHTTTSSSSSSHASNSKKRSSEAKSKSNKLTPRIAVAAANAASTPTSATNTTAVDERTKLQHKTYQVLRRKSMAVEREQHKKVSAVILKRKSISVARAHEIEDDDDDDDDVVAADAENTIQSKRSKTKLAVDKRDKHALADVDVTPKTNSSKKHKRSLEHANANATANNNNTKTNNNSNSSRSSSVSNDPMKIESQETDAKKSPKFDDKTKELESILSSVGLSRIARRSNDEKIDDKTVDKIAISIKEADDATADNSIQCENDGSDMDTFDSQSNKETIEVDAESPIPGQTARHKSTSNRLPKIALVPFIELKEEPRDDSSIEMLSNDDTELETSPMPMAMSTSDIPLIKTERTLSGEDSVMIVDENPSSRPSSSSANVSKLIENIRRGAIAVRDIDKMTKRSPKASKSNEVQRARKTFPRGIQLPSVSAMQANGVTLSSRARPQQSVSTSNNKRGPPMSSMVYIPLDGGPFSRSEVMPSISGPKLTSQPPPLTIVGSTSTTSSASNITNLCMNVPPPLSMAGTSLLINHAPTHAPTVSTQLSSASQHQQSIATSLQSTVPPPTYSSVVTNARPFATVSSGLLTEQLASAVTDSIVRAPPKLTSRPTAPLRSDGDTLFPSEAGSVCRTLMENAHRMTDFFRSVIEDTLSDIATTTNPEAKIKLLEIELEKVKFAHAKEMMELKANTDTLLNEMKKSMEKERNRTINETRKQCELERIRSVEETKKKQWCVNCGIEAQFYCCWNTSYCEYPCQLQHWSKHRASCVHVENNSNEGSNHRRNNLSASTTTAKPPKSVIHKDPPVIPVIHSAPATSTASNRNIAPRTVLPKNNSLLQKFNQYPPIAPNPHTIQRQATRTLPNQQCYAILSHPYEVFKTNTSGATTNLIQNIANASVSLSNMRTANIIPLQAIPPPLTTSKAKQLNSETIVIPSD